MTETPALPPSPTSEDSRVVIMKGMLRWGGLIIAGIAFMWMVMRGTHHHLPTKGNRELPTVHLRDMQGKWATWDQWKGKVKIISFWASWCEPCVEEMPTLQALMDHFKDREFV